MKTRKVKVVPHDPAWREAFEAEAAALSSVLGDEALAVHHIGSTAIPGISARPTVDVLIEVRKIEKVDDFDAAMSEKGFEAWGEYGIPGRRFFVKDRGTSRITNVHTFKTGTPEVERHLAFRDYLIQHPKTASAYAQLKKELAREHPADMESYMNGKDTFIKQTEGEALSWHRVKKQEADKPRARAEGLMRAESGGGAC